MELKNASRVTDQAEHLDHDLHRQATERNQRILTLPKLPSVSALQETPRRGGARIGSVLHPVPHGVDDLDAGRRAQHEENMVDGRQCNQVVLTRVHMDEVMVQVKERM
jgi:hypothetical protein